MTTYTATLAIGPAHLEAGRTLKTISVQAKDLDAAWMIAEWNLDDEGEVLSVERWI